MPWKSQRKLRKFSFSKMWPPCMHKTWEPVKRILKIVRISAKTQGNLNFYKTQVCFHVKHSGFEFQIHLSRRPQKFKKMCKNALEISGKTQGI